MHAKNICLLILVTGLAACAGGSANGGNDLDPRNPPPSPLPDDPFPEGTCGDINAVVSGQPPTVQLVIDQSGSMDAGFGGSMNRWEAVYDTLMAPGGVVAQLESEVRFGLSLYTSDDGFAGGQCPMLAEVSPSFDNRAAMDAVFAPVGPQGDTPTGETIDAVADALDALDVEGPKVIVLGTDGEPDTCAEPDPQNGQAQAIAAAQRAWDMGIQTYIVSVGDQVGAQHLQEMANAGAGLPISGGSNAPYYVALDPQELVDSFGTIVGGVSGCAFNMNGTVDPGKASQGLVALDGQDLVYGQDWTMVDENTFEVLGAACDTVQDGNYHHISAAFPCGTIVID